VWGAKPRNGLLKIAILIGLALLNVALVEILDKPSKVTAPPVHPR